MVSRAKLNARGPGNESHWGPVCLRWSLCTVVHVYFNAVLSVVIKHVIIVILLSSFVNQITVYIPT